MDLLAKLILMVSGIALVVSSVSAIPIFIVRDCPRCLSRIRRLYFFGSIGFMVLGFGFIAKRFAEQIGESGSDSGVAPMSPIGDFRLIDGVAGIGGMAGLFIFLLTIAFRGKHRQSNL